MSVAFTVGSRREQTAAVPGIHLSPRYVWNVRFPVRAAFACILPVKIYQKAVNCNQIRVLLFDDGVFFFNLFIGV